MEAVPFLPSGAWSITKRPPVCRIPAQIIYPKAGNNKVDPEGGVPLNGAYNPDELVDIQSIKLPADGDAAANAKLFFEAVKNPYIFKVDDIVVHVSFGGPDTGTLQSHIRKLL